MKKEVKMGTLVILTFGLAACEQAGEFRSRSLEVKATAATVDGLDGVPEDFGISSGAGSHGYVELTGIYYNDLPLTAENVLASRSNQIDPSEGKILLIVPGGEVSAEIDFNPLVDHLFSKGKAVDALSLEDLGVGLSIPIEGNLSIGDDVYLGTGEIRIRAGNPNADWGRKRYCSGQSIEYLPDEPFLTISYEIDFELPSSDIVTISGESEVQYFIEYDYSCS